MQRRRDMAMVAAAGVALALARPRWGGALEDRVVAAGWLAAVVLWAWLTVVGCVHAWATRTGRARWHRLTGALLPSAVRRRVEQLALAGLLVVPAAACADDGAARSAPVLVLEEATPLEEPAGGATPSHGSATPTTTTTVPAPPAAPPTTAAAIDPPSTPATADAPPPAVEHSAPQHEPGDGSDPDGPDPSDDPAFVVPVEAGTRVVTRGDNLWSVAAEHLAATTGSTPDTEGIRRYWAELVEENRATLASGDPDVIYPGEVLRLPPPSP